MTVGTVIAAAVVAKIAFQGTRTEGPVMYQTEKVLLIEVFQFTMVIRCGQIFGELVVSTTIVKLIAERGLGVVRTSVGPRNGQAFFVGGVSPFGVLKLTCG
ncbi:hypothetical protein D3C76_1656460 [compost metagenome]